MDDNGTPGVLNDDVQFNIGTLADGQTRTVTGTYTATANPSVNTARVVGFDEIGLGVFDTNQCSVMIPCTPRLRLQKFCPSGPVAPGGTLTFTGTITNNGNATLTSVFVFNDQPAPNTPVIGPLTLAPGAGTAFTGSYVVPANACTSVSDTLTAVAQAACLGTSIQTQATATCSVVATGCLAVQRFCPSAPFTTNQPVNITGLVSNCGNVTILNITVSDSRASLTPSFISSLAPGQVVPFSGTYLESSCTPPAGTTTASGFNSCVGTVNGSGTSTCTPVCDAITITKNCFLSGTPDNPVISFSGVVSNASVQSTLNNIVIVDDNGTPGIPGDDRQIVIGTLIAGQTRTYSGVYTATVNPSINTVRVSGAGSSGITVSNIAMCAVTIPCTNQLKLQKFCPATPAVPGGTLTFTGTITNNGNVTLNSVRVFNDQPVPNTPVFGPVTLAPGAGMAFSGSYVVPANSCGPVSDILTATAQFSTICSSGSIQTQAMATCSLAVTGALVVRRSCPTTPFTTNQPVNITGVVSNSGNVTVQNIFVTDSTGAIITPGMIASLAPGQSVAFSGSYLATTCDPVFGTTTASGFNNCVGTVTASGSSTCTPICDAITITKNCFLSGTPDNPVIGFSGVVSNASVQSTLNNIVIVDDNGTPGIPGDDRQIVIGTLFAGQTRTYSGFYTATVNPSINTVRVSGTGSSGITVSNIAMCAVTIPCTNQLKLQKFCPASPAVPGGVLTYTGTLTNNGNVTLTSVTVVNDQPVPNTPVLGPITLPPGAGVVFSGSYVVPANSCGPVSDILTATAQFSTVCSSGSIQTQAMATCSLAVTGALVVRRSCPTSLFTTNQPVNITGVVSNSGNVTIQNIFVTDSTGAIITPGMIASLAPGQSVAFSGSYIATTCDPVFGTTTASGFNNCVGTVAASGSSTCTPICDAITITKNCFLSGTPDNPVISFSGVVANTSVQSTLNNIVIVDDNGTPGVPGDDRQIVIGTLFAGQTRTYSGVYTATVNPSINTVRVSGTGPSGITVSNIAMCTVTIPCTNQLKLQKFCPATPVVPGRTLTYTGTITNVGNVTLASVTVVNDQPAPNTPVLGPITLPPGAGMAFSGSYVVPANACGPVSDTLTATAQYSTVCSSGSIQTQATATCSLTVTGALVVRRSCPTTPFTTNQPVNITGVVSNAGNVTIQNISLTDSTGASLTPPFITSLAPGQSVAFSGSYIATTCDSLTGTTTATGNNSCVGAVVGSGNSTCTPDCPVLTLVKTVSCSTSNGCDTGWSKMATGVKRLDPPRCPDFCYRFAITNDGTAPVTNVRLNDPDVGLNNVLVAASLAPHTGLFYFVRDFNQCFSTNNTATATAVSSVSGAPLSATDSASVTILTAAIDCESIVDSPDATDNMPGDDFLALPDGGSSHNVTFSIRVRNMGEVDLRGILVSNIYLFSRGCPTPPRFDLRVGESRLITLCTIPISCSSTPLTNTSSLHAEVAQGVNPFCLWDNPDMRNVYALSKCQVIIDCTNRVRCGMTECFPPYPYASSEPRTSIPFSESEVLRAFTLGGTDTCVPTQIRAYYNDEHALLLGIRRVIVKTANGSTTTDYPVSPLSANPGSVLDPQVGSTDQTGDQAGTDVSGRPMFPALFVTDITANPTSLAGDWQFHGQAIPPHAVFGTWKSAVRTIDKTTKPPKVEIDVDPDPNENHWRLDGGDRVPDGLVDQGYGAEVRWDVARLGLVPGHMYRLYFMVHDGDQTKSGGDVGQGCANVVMGQPDKAIVLTKSVTCSTSNGLDTAWGHTAIGAARLDGVARCPDFGYRLAITNIGKVPLSNITLIDDQLNLSGLTPPISLAAGAGRVFYLTNVNHCSDSTGTSFVRAEAAGTVVTAADSTTVTIKRVSLGVERKIDSADAIDGAPGDNYVLLPGGAGTHAVTTTVRIANTGDVDLRDITVSDDSLTSVPRFSLLVGQSTNLDLGTRSVADGAMPTTNQVLVTGEVIPGANPLGLWASADRKNVIASTAAQSRIECTANALITIYSPRGTLLLNANLFPNAASVLEGATNVSGPWLPLTCCPISTNGTKLSVSVPWSASSQYFYRIKPSR